MFVAFRTTLNRFILGRQKMLFMDGAHLSGSYEGTLLEEVALNANNRLFDVAYAMVSADNKDDHE